LDPGYEHRCAVWLGAKGLSATQTIATTAPTTSFFDTFALMPASHLLIAAPVCAPSCCSTDEYIVLTSPDPGASWACSRSGTAALQWPLLCLATQADLGFCLVLRLPTPTQPSLLSPCPPVQDIFSLSETLISTFVGWRWLRASFSVREAGLQRWCSLLWPRVHFLKFGSCCPCCDQASSGFNALGRRTDAWYRRP
jgi:hypothetical protein